VNEVRTTLWERGSRTSQPSHSPRTRHQLCVTAKNDLFALDCFVPRTLRSRPQQTSLMASPARHGASERKKHKQGQTRRRRRGGETVRQTGNTHAPAATAAAHQACGRGPGNKAFPTWRRRKGRRPGWVGVKAHLVEPAIALRQCHDFRQSRVVPVGLLQGACDVRAI